MSGQQQYTPAQLQALQQQQRLQQQAALQKQQQQQQQPVAVSQNCAVRYPEDSTIIYAMKLSIKEDKPIMMTYWLDSIQNKVVIYTDKKTNDKVIYKSNEEYTSPIVQKYNNKGDLICATENSLYLVSNTIQNK
jgi:hypothetical protein